MSTALLRAVCFTHDRVIKELGLQTAADLIRDSFGPVMATVGILGPSLLQV